MKNMKKFASLLLAGMMAAAMTITAAASSITVDIPQDVITKMEAQKDKTGGYNEKNHTYEVYQLLTGSFETQSGKTVIVDEAFGTGVTDALKTAYNNDAYEFLKAINGKTGDEVLALVDGKVQNPTTVTYGTNGYSLAGFEKGYYLIKDQDNSLDEKYDGYTKYILKVVDTDDEKVTAKMDIPEVEKKVKETNDTTGAITNWQDGADYDIGDKVPFQLSTKIISGVDAVSGKPVYDLYKTYKLSFVDTMSKGLTLDKNSVVVKLNGTAIDKKYYSVTDPDANNQFRVNIPDTKAFGAKAGDTITVEFEAELNKDAVIGSMGNPNKVYLEFSNNPNDEGEGKTPEDKVIVFTYKLYVNKIDQEGKELEGAGFTLYKEVPADYVAKTGEKVTEIDGKKYLQIGDEITGVTTFQFKGIDAGNYRLVETTVPTGFNKAQDITFTIKAVYDTNADDPKLISLEVINVDPADATFKDGGFSDYLSQGLVETDVVNKEGIELPETGGIGTTIFYVIGAMLMIGAGVVLVTRRRMSK